MKVTYIIEDTCHPFVQIPARGLINNCTYGCYEVNIFSLQLAMLSA
jgi:hypothetical protein